MCGMSRRNQDAVSVLVEHGADIEALDTYGMTPLHRMVCDRGPLRILFLVCVCDMDPVQTIAQYLGKQQSREGRKASVGCRS